MLILSGIFSQSQSIYAFQYQILNLPKHFKKYGSFLKFYSTQQFAAQVFYYKSWASCTYNVLYSHSLNLIVCSNCKLSDFSKGLLGNVTFTSGLFL